METLLTYILYLLENINIKEKFQQKKLASTASLRPQQPIFVFTESNISGEFKTVCKAAGIRALGVIVS
jgi:hypothetical protein